MNDASDALVSSPVDGRYRVLSRIARGGMSTVYVAEDLRLEREVALKVLYPHLAEDPTVTQRFEREAITAAQLSHPNVVNVYDQGVDDSGSTPVAYLAMEYVRGTTLRDIISANAPLSLAQTWKYLVPVTQGLAAAHRAGLVHRDVKPENVLVSTEGSIKVADFGLARAATQHTGTHMAIMGTVAYISPELLSGEKADQRSDVYALGILAFELLTGRQPFLGDTPVEVAMQHTTSRVPAPSQFAPGIPESVDEFVMHCTERDPEERPQNAQAVLIMLNRIKHEYPHLFSADSPIDMPEPQATVALQTSMAPEPEDPPAPPRVIRLDDEPEQDEPDYFASPAPVPSQESEPAVYASAGPLSVSAARQDLSEPARTTPRRASRPTHQLTEHKPVKFMLTTVGVIMLAAIAYLTGVWVGGLF